MVSEKLKLIRIEADLTQDKMAEIIGVSKKTLVQVEKGRKTLGFTAAALVAVLFRRGEIMHSLFGDATLDVLDLVATRSNSQAWYRTMGGKVWWTEERREGSYSLQKHVFTGHYRIIDEERYLHYYSLDPAEAEKRLAELTGGLRSEREREGSVDE
ncbi:helix-turn-helix domain-containing protein [Brevibacillus humidisoli]|uniref:helix-turn-helix transcriptional regulator n=1 Tax=Brevibacillus humidisoli TaxID=2895522 RepID=UPI001E5027E3|nr:helix-turn-helix domain-containing protein [Brevibacillus humidisoli]UFJ43053.1 helix-turn-helix domain-containing protein [Brevibacillus humidisoli]